MNLLLLAVVALASSGCHTSYELSERHFHVTPSVSDAQFAIMQAEVDHLCDVSDGNCIYISRESWHNKIYIGAIAQECEELEGCFAEFSDGTRELSISESAVNGGRLAQAFRHEIGHAAGCYGDYDDHLKDPGNVMYRRVSDIDWTQADLDCIARGLP